MIDDRAGTVDGARLGGSKEAIRRVLGEPTTEGFMLPNTPESIDTADIGLPLHPRGCE